MLFWNLIQNRSQLCSTCVEQSVKRRTSDLDVTGLRSPAATKHNIIRHVLLARSPNISMLNLFLWLLIIYVTNKVHSIKHLNVYSI